MKILDKPAIDLTTVTGEVDKECVDLCNTLNRLPGLYTFECYCGHGKWPYSIFFHCNNIKTLSRLGRALSRNYSDGRWEIVLDSTDTSPMGVFWLRSREILPDDKLMKSVNKMIENILYWFDDRFDEHFDNNADPICNNIAG